jgi:hypothetical protein
VFKAQVLASEAGSPYNTYDSLLEIPNGRDPNQNAWLWLQLRVKLNFVDSKNPLAGRTVNQGGKWFARDFDGYLFPMLDWPDFLIARFQREFAKVAEKTWNWQFVLQTPKTYSELDYQSFGGIGYVVRPNLLCLFRMAVHGPSGPIDTSPGAGPLRNGLPHRTINIFNLSLGTKQVTRDPSLPPNPKLPATRNVAQMDGLSFRSDAADYDDSDLFNPAWWNKEHKVLSNTVGHEVGHALGQCHIMGLKGNAIYAFGGASQTIWRRTVSAPRTLPIH